MLQHFQTYLRTIKRVSDHTFKAYSKDISDFFVFATLSDENDIHEVSHHLIRAWIVHLINNEVSNRSVNRKLSSLRAYFKWLLKEGCLTINPMQKVVGPKTSKRLPEFVKKEDIGSSFVSTEEYDLFTALIVELFYQTGIRLSELIHLETQNVQPESIKVLGKRNKERIIPISNQLYQKLQDYIHSVVEINDTGYVFCTSKGNKLYPKLVYRKINNYLSSVTSLSKRSPHVLRHTFATHMLNNGAGLETLKELLGHANLSATQIYTHNSFEEINKIYKQAHPRGGHKEN